MTEFILDPNDRTQAIDPQTGLLASQAYEVTPLDPAAPTLRELHGGRFIGNVRWEEYKTQDATDHEIDAPLAEMWAAGMQPGSPEWAEAVRSQPRYNPAEINDAVDGLVTLGLRPADARRMAIAYPVPGFLRFCATQPGRLNIWNAAQFWKLYAAGRS